MCSGCGGWRVACCGAPWLFRIISRMLFEEGFIICWRRLDVSEGEEAQMLYTKEEVSEFDCSKGEEATFWCNCKTGVGWYVIAYSAILSANATLWDLFLGTLSDISTFWHTLGMFRIKIPMPLMNLTQRLMERLADSTN